MEIQGLYNSLNSESGSNIDRERLKQDIKKLDIKGQELIYGLIVIHHLEDNETNVIPCGGKRLKNGCLRFDLNVLSDDLVKILSNFCEKHLVRMEEDRIRGI